MYDSGGIVDCITLFIYSNEMGSCVNVYGYIRFEHWTYVVADGGLGLVLQQYTAIIDVSTTSRLDQGGRALLLLTRDQNIMASRVSHIRKAVSRETIV